jgi:hypothetical protein
VPAHAGDDLVRAVVDVAARHLLNGPVDVKLAAIAREVYVDVCGARPRARGPLAEGGDQAGHCRRFRPSR